MAFENEIKLTIEGATLDECRQKLYKEHGQNFTILNRETKLKKGFLGFNEREVQVVTYVINHKKNDDMNYAYANKDAEAERLEKNRQELLKNYNNTLLNSQLTQVNAKLEELQNQLATMNETKVAVAPADEHETISRIEELLGENEFTYDYIKMIVEKIRSTFSLEQLDDFKLVQRYVVDWIGESIEIAETKYVRPPRVITIVGPTGVGKTTTIAKLAANTILDATKNNQTKPELCILTIDTMRVGALEQLAKFGEILGKNVLKAENADDVRQIYEDYREHVDYIFIDTSGYSPNDASHISKMKEILDVGLNPTVYLSVTASTKASDLVNIFRNFEPFAFESVIVTKCDETKAFGNIISVLWSRHKSIAYITDGQRVPKNISKANIVEILKNLSGFEIDRVHIEDKFGEK
mgnify:CR=1 FL=1